MPPSAPQPALKAESDLPTDCGTGRVRVYGVGGVEHLSITFGKPGADGVLVRVHSECITGEALGSQKCDCGGQLREALAAIGKEGGVLVYLRQEGRGIGLSGKIAAYALQEREGLDTAEANLRLGHPVDARDYSAAAGILAAQGVRSVRLLTNNPDKVAQLQGGGIQVQERLPLLVDVGPRAKAYLRVKRDRMGHYIP